MLQIHFLREHKNAIIERLNVRNHDFTKEVEHALVIDERRRLTQQEMDEVNHTSNTLSKQIGDLFKQGKKDEANAIREQTVAIKEKKHLLEARFSELDAQLRDALSHIPNVPNTLVPAGKSDAENQFVEDHGAIPELGENAKPHWELAEDYKLIDFETGSKITGAGFPVYTGQGARLQRSLVNFFLDEAADAGYGEVIPPFVVNEASGYGTGQLPDKEGQMYHCQDDDLYLIPTAEVPVTNIYRDEILKEADLPVKLCAHSPCFRREAGSYGKDVRGLNRLHQFEKVEIVQIQHPDRSYDTLMEMVEHVKGLLEKLELPYRVVRLCGGDLGFTSALTYDLEVWSAAQQRWLEVSSVSNFETYQANRLKCRYRDENNKAQLAHTLNGSALALPRIMAALLENNQEEGGIRIPRALQPYTRFDKITG